jgi:hypothetical protein
VDDDVVMEPTQQSQVRRVVVAAVGTMPDVMHLEAVTGGAAIDRAAAVTPRHQAAQHRRDRPGGIRHRDRTAILQADELDSAFTEDAFQYQRSHPRSVDDLGTGFTLGASSQAGVHDHCHQRLPTPASIRVGVAGRLQVVLAL